MNKHVTWEREERDRERERKKQRERDIERERKRERERERKKSNETKGLERTGKQRKPIFNTHGFSLAPNLAPRLAPACAARGGAHRRKMPTAILP